MVGYASGVKAGTGVKVGIWVKVGMAVAIGLGVHVGGRVNGTEVCGGWGLAVGLPQAERNMISSNTLKILNAKKPW